MEKYRDSLNIVDDHEFSDMCRICAKKQQKNQIQSLFSTKSRGISLAEQLQTCLHKPVRENDGLPQNICNSCISLVLVAFDLRIKYISSEKIFNELRSKPQNVNKKDEIVIVDMNSLEPVFEVNDKSILTRTYSRKRSATSTIVHDEKRTKIGRDETENIAQSSDEAERIDNAPPSDKDENFQLSNDGICINETDNCLISSDVESTNLSISSSSDEDDHLFECYRCKRGFDRYLPLRRHLKSPCDHVETEKIHDCDICEESFTTRNELNVHKRQSMHIINGSGELFKCKYCPKSYISLENLMRHKHVYECHKCSNKYKYKKYLTRHMLKCGEKKEHICHICNKKFAKLFYLKKHEEIHTSELSFLCSTCGKPFKTAGHLGQHVKIHSGKKFLCDECPARYATNADLMRHMCWHTGERKYFCDKCPKSYFTSSSLSGHKKHHDNIRRYACTMCPKRFYSSIDLKTHIRTHTGEKPFKCDFCDRAYAQKSDLTKHSRTHVGMNTYRCQFCPDAFRFHADLRNHLTDHYKEQKNKIIDGCDDAELEKMEQIELEWRKHRPELK